MYITYPTSESVNQLQKSARRDWKGGMRSRNIFLAARNIDELTKLLGGLDIEEVSVYTIHAVPIP